MFYFTSNITYKLRSLSDGQKGGQSDHLKKVDCALQGFFWNNGDLWISYIEPAKYVLFQHSDWYREGYSNPKGFVCFLSGNSELIKGTPFKSLI